MNLNRIVFSSPLGEMQIITQDDAVCALDYTDEWSNIEKRLKKRFGNFQLQEKSSCNALKSIITYFEGDIEAVNRVAVDPGGTSFQKRVWKALREIPAGQTMSYGELAQKIGVPGASRAVGTANRLNPIAIVIPCHRVIGSNGMLCGYAGGLDRKRWLLDHEGRGQFS